MRTKSTRFPIRWWLLRLEMPATQFNLSSTFLRTSSYTRCEMVTSLVQKLQHTLLAKTLQIIWEQDMPIKFGSWLLAMIRQMDLSFRSLTTYQIHCQWVTVLMAMVECFVAVFSINIITKVKFVSIPTALSYFYQLPDITREEAYEIMRKCAREIQTRLIISQPKFHVTIVDADGVKRLEDITTENLKN